jgi:hypothetical protein
MLMDEETNWKAKTILVGGLIGALTGMAAAFIIVQQSESQGTRPNLGTGDGLRLGVKVMSLLRDVTRLGEGVG